MLENGSRSAERVLFRAINVKQHDGYICLQKALQRFLCRRCQNDVLTQFAEHDFITGQLDGPLTSYKDVDFLICIHCLGSPVIGSNETLNAASLATHRHLSMRPGVSALFIGKTILA